MRLSNIVRLYRVRLRSRIVQELFAVLGIAVGVALLFSSQVASTSLDGSVQRLTNGIVGNMLFQLTTRDTQGFDQQLVYAVRGIPGVKVAVPALDERVSVIGPLGRVSVDLIGTDPYLTRFGGPLIRNFPSDQLTRLRALALPSPIVQTIGAAALQPVEVQTGTSIARALLVGGSLVGDTGELAHSSVAIAPLAYAQSLTDMVGRITSIFVDPRPGHDREVHADLERIAGDHLNVRPADFNATLFRQAAGPTDQSTVLFSSICALVGFLFAFNALLLTTPQRRNLIADLRIDGYTTRMIVEVLLFDALALGVLASLLGLALGELFSVALFNTNPGYLSLGFPVDSQRIVTWQSIALALGGGVTAAFFGVLVPLRREIALPLANTFSQPAHPPGGPTWRVPVGLVCLGVTTAILLAEPRDAILGIVSLLGALLALLPTALAAVVAGFDRLRSIRTGVSPYLAVIELQSHANRARSLAIAATGAIAVFGSVAIQGAHSNLQRGLDRLVHQLSAAADLWVIPPGTQNLLETTPFHGIDISALAHVPGVVSVEPSRASLLDYDDRRVWVLAPSSTTVYPVPPSQLLSGDLASVTAKIRAGGWAVVSQALAAEHHLRIGGSFVLPAPRPTSFRVAGLSTNLGWPPGAIILNATDYARAWESTDPSAYAVMLAAGVSATRVAGELRRVLGPGAALGVETSHEREQRQRATSRQGLERLTQISWLVLIAAVMAMGAAMGAMIWQRRRQLADLKVDGFRRAVLWRALLWESLLLVGAGCSIGAIFGIYGELLLSHALATVTDFPVVFSASVPIALVSFILVTAVAVTIVAVPGYMAARVRPAISMQD
jgi:putative ABC transport system permease protein